MMWLARSYSYYFLVSGVGGGSILSWTSVDNQFGFVWIFIDGKNIYSVDVLLMRSDFAKGHKQLMYLSKNLLYYYY